MKELYYTVNYYGIGEIIRSYSGFSKIIPLPVSIQHGWYLTPTEHDALTYVPENWYWNEEIELLHKKEYNKIKTRAVGSPFLYLLLNINYRVLPKASRKGSIVFPCHSSRYVHSKYDYDLYADMLDQLSENFKPITVCFYHLDQEADSIKPFIKKGFKIVSNGNNLYDKDFLYNFINNTKDKRFAFSNHRTSALLYASAMGLTSYLYGPDPLIKYNKGISENEMYSMELEKRAPKAWKKYFAYPNANLIEQQNYCKKILGSEFILSRREMKKILNIMIFDRRFVFTLLRSLLFKSKLGFLIYKIIRRKNSL